jgi:hypothetical protein
VASGVVGSGTTSLDLAAAVGTGDIRVAIDSAKQYYIEITGGTLEGQRFEIDEAATDAGDAVTLVLDSGSPLNTKSPVPDLSGSPFVIREHYTWEELFPPASLQQGTSDANSDVIFVRNGTAWEKYFLSSASGGTWVNAAGAPLDQNSRVLAPCEGVFLVRKGAPLDLMLLGEVRDNDFACPLAAGQQMVGSGYPLDLSPAQRDISVASGFTGGTSLVSGDQILTWKADTTMLPTDHVYQTAWLVGAGYDRWVNAGDSALVDQSAFAYFLRNHAVIMNLRNAQPDHVDPAPWTAD